MLTNDKKVTIYSCIKSQFPDPGLYRISRLAEWLETNGYTMESLGYASFREFAKDFTEMFTFQNDNNDVPINGDPARTPYRRSRAIHTTRTDFSARTISC